MPAAPPRRSASASQLLSPASDTRLPSPQPRVPVGLRSPRPAVDPRMRDWGPGLEVLEPVTLLTVRGPVTFTPTVPVAASVASNALACPLERARWQIVTAIPDASAQAMHAALTLFTTFLRTAAGLRSFSEVTPAHVAHFILWRAARPLGVLPPPAPYAPSVAVSTAAADVAKLRRLAIGPGLLEATQLYGREVTDVLKALRSSDDPDSVRKTPVSMPDLVRRVQEAIDIGTHESLRRAIALSTAFFAFCRGGETALRGRDVDLTKLNSEDNPSITVIFRFGKARGGILRAPLVAPVPRVLSAPPLLRSWRAWVALAGSPADDDVVFGAHAGTAAFRRLLVAELGEPPSLPGELRPLPWSVRAGAASAALAAGVSAEVLKKLGRWRSDVALSYAILTPSIQGKIWGEAAAGWFERAEEHPSPPRKVRKVAAPARS